MLTSAPSACSAWITPLTIAGAPSESIRLPFRAGSPTSPPLRSGTPATNFQILLLLALPEHCHGMLGRRHLIDLRLTFLRLAEKSRIIRLHNLVSAVAGLRDEPTHSVHPERGPISAAPRFHPVLNQYPDRHAVVTPPDERRLEVAPKLVFFSFLEIAGFMSSHRNRVILPSGWNVFFLALAVATAAFIRSSCDLPLLSQSSTMITRLLTRVR